MLSQWVKMESYFSSGANILLSLISACHVARLQNWCGIVWDVLVQDTDR